MPSHRLAAAPETIRWGSFDAAYPPLLTIASGETVVLECVSAGSPEVLPPPETGLAIPPALSAIIAANPPRMGGHILTGPVAVAGAMPGDMLEVKVEAIALGADWGYCGFRPLVGTLPEDFPERYLSHIPIDRAAGTCRLPWGTELKLAPFFGVMGVAPPPEWGTISTIEPRAHGGNLDNKELGAGATLFLPVFAPGGLFSAGDGHGVQGDKPGSISRREYIAAVEYGYHPLLRPIVADANEYICGKYITANRNEIADSLKNYVALFKIVIGNISSVIRRYRQGAVIDAVKIFTDVKFECPRCVNHL